jgi:adenylate cyclase
MHRAKTVPPERVERKLAAILAADVAGYSRLMGADEEGTLARLKAHRRELIDPKLAEHRGRVVKTTGDGILTEFPSVVDAVHCAIEVQRGMSERNAGVPSAQRIELRVGINLGDIIIDGDDIHGDGVNIAARLEALADPGGVCISQTVLDHARGKIPFDVEDGGDKALKNIAKQVHVYRILLDSTGRQAALQTKAPALALPDKPSIAVLPFANMSGDPEQEYFSDGITEDIITDLSKTSALSVIARNTVFTFKGKAVDMSKIAEQLNVSHIVEGSVRKADGRVRISAQLVDGRKGDHVWAERYDRDLKDIFALQDEISQAIVAALKIKLMPAEKNAIEARSTKHPEAYELYLLGRHHYSKFNIKNVEIAVHFYQRALEIDPNYARAWALLAMCQERLRMRGRSEETGLPAAERALLLDPSLAAAHAVRGLILMRLGRYDEALAAHEESLRLEPESFDVRFHFGWACLQLGRYEAGDRAWRASRSAPRNGLSRAYPRDNEL